MCVPIVTCHLLVILSNFYSVWSETPIRPQGMSMASSSLRSRGKKTSHFPNFLTT